jgi:replicative DNA helicase
VKYGAATQIIVSEYDKEEQKVSIVERKEIPSTEFTFDNAVKKIVKMHKFWNIDRVILDRGYGEYQVEILKKRLGKGIVRGVAFNEKIEVIDPTDRTVDKKMAKHFMVNQTSILLERDQLIISKNDGEFKKQMLNYRVVKKTRNGKPVYTSENEHALDAFMLTILCYTTEFPEIAKVLEKTRYAKIMGKVNKKLHNNEEKIFDGKFANTNKIDDEDLEGEPQYIRHMKSIQRANKDGGQTSVRKKGRSAWGSRGRRNSRPPGRSSF